MPTIDLGTPPRRAAGWVTGLPRRLTLTLPELQLAAEYAGGAPLPFDLTDAAPATVLGERLGGQPGGGDAAAYAATLASLHDPRSSLARRGLLVDTAMDEGLIGAVGLLATPRVAVDLDVTAGGGRVRAWHRQQHRAVATLSTTDGVVFELAWFPVDRWPDELARIAVLPEDVALLGSGVPPLIDLPYHLLDAAAEATSSGRADLLSVLVADHGDQVRGPDGRPLTDLETISLLAALTTETRGRLRALVADVAGDGTTVVGVVSWVLLSGGWRALRPRRGPDTDRIVLAEVAPADLAAELAPVLAEVGR